MKREEQLVVSTHCLNSQLTYFKLVMVMAEQFSLVGRDAHNLIGAFGEIVAWDTLRKSRGVWAWKIGSWNFFPEGYPDFRDRRERLSFLTKKQADFVENKEANQIIEFDFVGVKCKSFGSCTTQGETEYIYEGIEGVYLIEVKAGRGQNIRHYIRNPVRAFQPENIRKAKAIGFKVALVVVELLENWKYQVTYRDM